MSDVKILTDAASMGLKFALVTELNAVFCVVQAALQKSRCRLRSLVSNSEVTVIRNNEEVADNSNKELLRVTADFFRYKFTVFTRMPFPIKPYYTRL